MVNIGVITVSDRASKGIYEDISGEAIKVGISEYLTSEHTFHYRLIADEIPLIESAIKELSDELKCDLILTTGGTGPSIRDVTPEATVNVCQKMMPGFGELMRMESLKYVPTAILSRQSAGIRNSSLIINLPGKPKSINECLDAVFPAVPYCIDLIGGAFLKCNDEIVKVFRPKNS